MTMVLLFVWTMVVHSAMAGDLTGSYVSVRMPYLNPAGITYASTTIPALSSQYNSPLQYTNPLQYNSLLQYTTPHQYNSPLQYTNPLQYNSLPQYTTPLHYSHNSVLHAAPVQYVRAAVPYYFPQVSYSAPQLPAIPGVPVARYQPQEHFNQKVVDAVKPEVATRRYQVRRPAIQNEFFDIEERIIVRPVGSAVLELEQPVAGTQTRIGHPVPAYPTPLPPHQATTHPLPVHQTVPIYQPSYPSYHQPTVSIPSRPSPSLELISNAPSTSPPEIPQDPVDDDSISVENPEFARLGPQIFPPQNQAKAEGRADPVPKSSSQTEATTVVFPSTKVPPLPGLLSRTSVNPAQSFIDDQVESRTDSPEQSQLNQKRLIEFLTSRGGVSELSFSPTGLGHAGHVRGRVLSATRALHGSPAEHSFNTRRVVVATPIETVQEVEVVEPFAKLDRLAVGQPALVKSTPGVAPLLPSALIAPSQHNGHPTIPLSTTLCPTVK